MQWAACCLCFFRFLRSGEVVAPTTVQYDPSCHLCFGDVQVNNRASPSLVQVRIKASNTEPFWQRVTVVIGRTDNCLCPVTAILSFLVAQWPAPGPLLAYEDRRFLTREAFVAAVRAALAVAGLEAKDYAGHSFRIGAAKQQPARTFRTH